MIAVSQCRRPDPLPLFLGLLELLLPPLANAAVGVAVRVRLHRHPGEEVHEGVVSQVLTHLSES